MNPEHFALFVIIADGLLVGIANHPVGAVLMAVTLGLMVWNRRREAGKEI